MFQPTPAAALILTSTINILYSWHIIFSFLVLFEIRHCQRQSYYFHRSFYPLKPSKQKKLPFYLFFFALPFFLIFTSIFITRYSFTRTRPMTGIFSGIKSTSRNSSYITFMYFTCWIVLYCHFDVIQICFIKPNPIKNQFLTDICKELKKCSNKQRNKIVNG